MLFSDEGPQQPAQSHLNNVVPKQAQNKQNQSGKKRLQTKQTQPAQQNNHQKAPRTRQNNNRPYQTQTLPIDSYCELDQLQLSSVGKTKNEKSKIVVILKHSQQVFEEASYDSYRCTEVEAKVRLVSEIPQQRKDLQNFYRRRYYLFSKYDQGIKMDQEGWYSVTPEKIAEHIALRVKQDLSPCASKQVRVMDAFVGVGGNLIQFAKICGYCLGVDQDPVKVEYTDHNAGTVYGLQGKYQVIEHDFLKLPPAKTDKIDAVFMSPPWGGTGYQVLKEYGLEHIFPDFDTVIDKALQYSSNLMLFLPRNTSITDLIKRLTRVHDKLSSSKQLLIEVEKLMVGQSCKAIVVYTGDLVRITPQQVTQTFIRQFCTQNYTFDSNQTYQTLSKTLENHLEKAGYGGLTNFIGKRSPLQKVVETLPEQSFGQAELIHQEEEQKDSKEDGELSEQSVVAEPSISPAVQNEPDSPVHQKKRQKKALEKITQTNQQSVQNQQVDEPLFYIAQEFKSLKAILPGDLSQINENKSKKDHLKIEPQKSTESSEDCHFYSWLNI